MLFNKKFFMMKKTIGKNFVKKISSLKNVKENVKNVKKNWFHKKKFIKITIIYIFMNFPRIFIKKNYKQFSSKINRKDVFFRKKNYFKKIFGYSYWILDMKCHIKLFFQSIIYNGTVNALLLYILNFCSNIIYQIIFYII